MRSADLIRSQDLFDNEHPNYVGYIGLGLNPALADVADVVRVFVVEEILRAERAADRQVEGLGEAREAGAGELVPAASAEDRQRPLGAGQELAESDHVIGAGMRLHRAVGAGLRGRDPVTQHVLGQGQHHRPHAPGGRHMEGAADELGDALGTVDLCHPLGHLAEHAAEVDLLEGLALDHLAADLADEEDHRGRVLEGDVHAGGGVGGARPTGDEADTGPARQLAIGIGHHRRPALLAADGQGDLRRIVERVERRQIALAGHAEGMIGALRPERIDQDLPAGSEVLAIGHGSPRSRGPL